MNSPRPLHALALRLLGSDNRQSMFALGSLLYLVFLFLPALLPGMRLIGWLLPTLLSLPLFLVLYAASWRALSPWREVAIMGIGALALVLLPFNPAAHTYVIYAVATATGGLPLRRALLLSALILAIYVLMHLSLGYPGMVAAFTCVMATAIGIGNALATAYHRKDAALRLSQDEVRQLAQLAERERIGRDLHDLLGHTLSVIVLKAELAHRLYDRDRDGARREIAEVERIARETLGQVRRAVMGIRAAGLRAELAGAKLALDAVGMRLQQRIVADGLAPEFETALALVLREATTNIVRHSGAQQVQVSLEIGPRWVQMHIEDDGRGGHGMAGSGVAGMRERVQALAGRFEWHSDERGTRIDVAIPLDPAERSAPAAAWVGSGAA
jgi:two-component system, NarL family, sensor histidine kinase DesK